MKFAITGGTGFVGRHLAKRLVSHKHDVRLLARGVDPGVPWMTDYPLVEFVRGSVTSKRALETAFRDCNGVAHLAGVNRETADQYFQDVHVRGTRHVVETACSQEVDHLSLLSFLRARPDCESGYHDTKWQAEEIVRSSDIPYTVLKSGVIYGKGDHMVDHLSKVLSLMSVFFLVGKKPRKTAPVHVSDVVDLLVAGLTEDRLENRTVAVTGPERMFLKDAVRRVAGVLGHDPFYVRLPLFLQYLNAGLLELFMSEPPASLAQVQILSEGLVEPVPEGICDPMPEDLQPDCGFTDERIREALPDRRRFDTSDLRCPTGDTMNVIRRTWARLST